MAHTPMYDPRDAAQFRLSRAIMAAGENNFHNTWEYGLLREAAERSGRAIHGNGFFVPFELLQRDLTTSTAGHLVAVETPAALDVLRPASKVLTAGAQMYDVTGDVSLPLVKTPGTAYWLQGDGEGAVTPTQAVIGATSLMPKNLVSLTTVSMQLRRQVTSLDAFLAREMIRTTGTAVDLAVLAGSGVFGEPQGIHNTSGIDAVAGASLDWADVLGMIEAVNTANGQNITFIGSPAVETLLAGRERITGGGRAIWDDGDPRQAGL
jgi:HK97 family phage major capsid protein